MMANMKSLFSSDWRNVLGQCSLEVTGGAHAGASTMVVPGGTTVGTSPANDVILAGDEMAARHFRLEVDANPLKGVVLHALDGSCLLARGERLEMGEYCTLTSGDVFQAGSASFRLTRAVEGRDLAVPAIKAGVIVLVGAIIGLSWSLIGDLSAAVRQGSSLLAPVQASVEPPAVEDSPTSSLVPAKGAPEPGRNLEPYVWTIRARLEDLSLQTGLRVAANEDGTLKVYGQISDRQVPLWNEFLRWYDGQAGYPQLVREVRHGGQNDELPRLQSVWLGNDPSADFAGGITARIGDIMPGDWKIVAIQDRRVVLERDGSRTVLTY
ncbi:hypothetical protein CSC94_14450 [Zhengella mangrovi]|uniref:YscD cytoplasmic domain-containing protein n=2 Tax=Zhengella mangrovi TaxID=1982044 RepID=A0A2G1QLR5_9HYPH|nr:hypothetical protein CSC94_14450 [Zhengella mangrovi]